MASGDTSTCSSNCVTFAANCANVVVASLQAPKVTRARNSLPVSFDARLTKPVRRAAASMSSDAKKSVNMETALRVHMVMGVSLVWCEDAKGTPSYHRGETSTAHGNSIGYRFMRMTPYPLPAGSGLLQDLGFLSFTLPQVEILIPMKKP